jgi:hypothetical protein
MACQKKNLTNGTNFYKQNIQGIKSRFMCWAYQTNIRENSFVKDI